MQTICQLVICDYLGISIISLQGENWYQKYLGNICYSSIIDEYSFLGLYGMKNAVRIGDRKAIDAFSKFYPNNPENNLGKSDIRSAKQSVANGLLEWIKTYGRMEKQLNKQLYNKEQIGWPISTALNRTSEIVLAIWTCQVFDNKQSRSLLSILFRRTMRMMKRIIDSGYMCVSQINQINSNLVRLGFYYGYFFGDYSNCMMYISRGLKEYSDVSSIDGIIDSIGSA